MPSFDGWEIQKDSPRLNTEGNSGGGLGVMLFESLVHHLIEKGVLTKNDALSILQTVAQVKQGQLDAQSGNPIMVGELALLRRLYESFEALRERPKSAEASHHNVLQLRPPVHGDAPKFPIDN